MKKVLFTATEDYHILKFHLPFLKYFKENGYEVHVATNSENQIPFCDVKHCVSFERKPLRINNIKAFLQLKKIILKEKYNIIHTHTPVGSVITRLSAKKARKKYNTRIIYTAHGFHFFKGSSIKNWLLYYPIERYLSKYTDTLILINVEDFKLAKKKFSKRCIDIQYVPGVGIDDKLYDESNFSMQNKKDLKKKLNIDSKDFVMIFPARLDKNKNQIFLINAMEKLVKKYPNIKLLLPGNDELDGFYQKKVNEKELSKNILFLGFRNDINMLLSISDIAVSSSIREGLPVNIMESFFLGLPVIAKQCRGVDDLIINNENGFVVKDEADFCDKVELLLNNKVLYNSIKNNNLNKSKNYCIKRILDKMDLIYQDRICVVKKNFIYYLKEIRKKLQIQINKIGSKKRNKLLKRNNITIISNNCFAGITYEYLNLPFSSPTIGLYFFAQEYIKFIYNIKHYINCSLKPLDICNSKYKKELISLKQENVILGVLDDIEIVFLHYKTFNEAKEKWERRCKRVNYESIIYKFNDQNLCTKKELDLFDKFNAKNKICFTSSDYGKRQGFIYMDKYKKLKCVKEDAFYYHKYLDIVRYINDMKNCLDGDIHE